jgi:two-component system, NtrC family, sensor kinase
MEISDNGPGVNPTLQKSLFETFTSTKIQGENLGLGLAIVKTIVSSYSGTIEVALHDKDGAAFTVSLPVWQNDNKENEK